VPVVDPTKELEASVRRVELELKDLLVEREHLERQRQELDQKIGKRMNYLRATADLLKDLRPESVPKNDDSASMRDFTFDLSQMSQFSALEPIARSGYGSATRGVVALIAASEQGATAREMIDAITQARFEVRDPDTAVRSALKNLRKQGKVQYIESTGRYQLTPIGRSTLR
jgi:hypothetical protein